MLGAGFMGAGVAYVAASAGLEVVLIDRDQESADKGKAHSEKLISSQIAKGRAKSADRDALLARIHASADYAALKGCDLVVEAVFEDRAVKKEATEKAQAVLGGDVIFASNTSTLPIASLAETAEKPENFIGVHFFSPVDKMMLVEIIMGAKTGAARAGRRRSTSSARSRRRRSSSTTAAASSSTAASRNYMVEAHKMLMEGVPPAMIENAARMAGMPVGPLALNDEVGVDLSWKILQAAKKDLGPQAVDSDQEKLIEAMVVKEQRFGRKNGKGFYDYPGGGREDAVAGPGQDRRQGARSRCDRRAGAQGPLPLHRGAGGGALHGGGRRHRPARGRRRLDPRLRLRAVHRRRAVADRRHRRQGVRRPRRGAGGQTRPALRAERRAEGDGGQGRDLLRPRRRQGAA